jgi:hypothetical protein
MKDAGAWLDAAYPDLSEQLDSALTKVLESAWSRGWHLGMVSATALIQQHVSKQDDSDDESASEAVDNEDLQSWISTVGSTIVRGIRKTRMNRLKKALMKGVALPLAALVKSILGLNSDASDTDTTSSTEVDRIIAQAALNAYMNAGVEWVAWQTSGDPNVCQICEANSIADAVRLNEVFPSGDSAPPIHPRCDCQLVPADSPTGTL